MIQRIKNVVWLTCLSKNSLSNLCIKVPEQGMQKNTKNNWNGKQTCWYHYLSYNSKICWHVCHIDISEKVCLFRSVICPLTDWVMCIDNTRYLWACSGCTHSSVWLGFHKMYCPSNIMHECNPAVKMTKEVINDPCIPIHTRRPVHIIQFKHCAKCHHIFASCCQKLRWKCFLIERNCM